MRPLRFFSWFSGIGCFDLGLERAGWSCAGSCEIDSFARRVYEARFGGPVTFEDITHVEAKDIPAADLWVAGFPCTDLSCAGRRAGIHAARSGLIWQLLDLWDAVPADCAPEWLLLENVPGLLSGRDDADPANGAAEGGGLGEPAKNLAWMGILLGALADRGLRFAYRILDAQFFGLAQRRRRVFILARRSGAGIHPAEVLLEPEGGIGNPAACGKARARTAERAQGGAGVVGALGSAGADRRGHRVESVMRGEANGEAASEALIVQPIPFGTAQITSPQNRTACRPRDPAGTLAATERSSMVAYLDSWSMHSNGSPNQAPVKMDGLSDALNTTSPGGVAYEVPAVAPLNACSRGRPPGCAADDAESLQVAGMAVRRPTPLECERLQGLPDGHTCLCGCAPYSTAACRCPDGPRYQAIGNGGAVSVMTWIGRRLRARIEARS